MSEKRKPKKRHRPEHGQGSFYFRTSDERWVGSIMAGWSRTGARRRITVSDKREDAAWDKFVAMRKRVAIEGLPASSDQSVAKWVTEWLKHRAGEVKPKTFASEASVLRRWVVPTVGTRRLSQVGPQDVRAITGAMSAAGLSTTHQRYAARIFQQALKAAALEGFTVPERALLAPKPRAAVSDRAAMPIEDAVNVLAEAAKHKDGSRWLIAFLQGLRQGEALGLTWDEVDLARGTLTVRWSMQEVPRRPDGTLSIPAHYERRHLVGQRYLLPPKSKAGLRTIPLIPVAADALAAWREVAPQSPHGLVWPTARGGPMNAKSDRKRFYELQAAAGVSRPGGGPYLLHEVRHTTVSLLLAAGVSPQVVESIVGHSRLVESYVHVDTAQMRRALAALGEALALE